MLCAYCFEKCFIYRKSIFFHQKRRERGRIDVRGIKLVEPAILHGEGGDASAPNVREKILISSSS